MTDLAAIYGRVLSMIGIGRVTASQAQAASGTRRLQLRFDEAEAHDGLPAPQQYGVASRPLDGADAIVIFPGGDRSRGIVIAVNDRRYQLDLAPGEVALHDDQGQVIRIGRNGIDISTSLPVNLTTTEIVTVDGSRINLGAGATLPVKLANDAPATKVYAV